MYDAINKGIKMATGDVVGILNADDVLESPDTLAHVVECFNCVERAERLDAVYADIRFVKDDLETTVRYYSAKNWKPWMLQWGKMPPHPSVYIKRSVIDEYGLYKLGYDIAADYELIIRYLRKAKLNARYLNMCVVKMRMGGKSTRGWQSFMTLNKEIVRGNLENGYFCCFPMLLPKYLFKIFEFILPRIGVK
jgi:glycosyltransferase involved in cell wall biosynthesis